MIPETDPLHASRARSRGLAILAAGILIYTGCPGAGRPPPDEEQLAALLGSPEAKAYDARRAEAGGGDVGDLEGAALGYLWMRDRDADRAVFELRRVNARALKKFERRILYLLRGAAYYSQGWLTLAEKEFREAGQISLEAGEVNVEGTNTEPILLTDLLARAGEVLCTPDRGLTAADLGRLQEAAGLVGDNRALSYVRAEIGRRSGDLEGIELSLETLLVVAEGEVKKRIEKAISEIRAGGEPDLDFLTEPDLLVQLGAAILGPALPGTKAGGRAEEVRGKAADLLKEMKAPPPGKPKGE